MEGGKSNYATRVHEKLQVKCLTFSSSQWTPQDIFPGPSVTTFNMLVSCRTFAIDVCGSSSDDDSTGTSIDGSAGRLLCPCMMYVRLSPFCFFRNLD